MTALGSQIQTEATSLQEQSQFISSETDIKLFISEHKSQKAVPIPQNPEQFACSTDLQSYKNELASK